MLSFSPLDFLDEIWDLNESVSQGFLTYSDMSKIRGCDTSTRLKKLNVERIFDGSIKLSNTEIIRYRYVK